MMHYRKATVDDIPEMVRLRIMFLTEVTQQNDAGAEIAQGLELYFTRHLPDGDYVNWLALDDEVIVSTGGICFYTIPPNFANTTGDRAYILNVYTLPAYRLRGISKQLFGLLMQEATDRNVTQISLHTTADGMGLYEQFGFTPTENEMVWGRHI